LETMQANLKGNRNVHRRDDGRAPQLQSCVRHNLDNASSSNCCLYNIFNGDSSKSHKRDYVFHFDRYAKKRLAKRTHNCARAPLPVTISPRHAAAKPSIAMRPTNNSFDFVKPRVSGTVVFLPSRTWNCCALTSSRVFETTLPLLLPAVFACIVSYFHRTLPARNIVINAHN
jgi:hypothetical protein